MLVHAAVLAGYLLLTLIFTWPLVLNLTTAIPGDSFDGWQNYWNQWWLAQALVDRLVSPLYTDILYAPTGVTLYFHTLNPLNGLITLPIQWVSGLILAYNAVVFISWVLAGYGMFLLARWVLGVRSPAAVWAAWLAGLVYTLSPFHMAHLLGHMQVMSLQWLPFYLLYLLRAMRQSRDGRPWLRSALLAGLFLVFNGLSDWYFVLYLFLFTGLVIVWQWPAAVHRHSRQGGTVNGWAAFSLRMLWVAARPALIAGCVFVVLLSFWLVPMIQEARQFQFMVRPPADLYVLSASVMDFLVPNRLHSLWRPQSFTWIGNQIAPISERTISIGYLPLALAVAAAGMAWRKAFFWWAGALLFFMLALGPQWHWGNITWESIPPAVAAGQEVASWTPYALLNRLVPFMRISRSVSRFALMVQLCLAVLTAIGLHALLLRWFNPQRRFRSQQLALLVGAAAAVVLLAEYWVAPYPLSLPDTPAYYSRLAADPDARAVLNLPMNYDRPGYLLYQTVHGKPLTVAYISRDDPRTLTERTPVLQHFRHLGDDIIDVDPAAIAPTIFADLDVGTVILDRYKMPGGLEKEYTEALAGRIFGDQPPLFSDERLTVYRVTAPIQRLPYLQLGPQNWGPLVVNEDGGRQRALTGSTATVEVIHASEPVQVAVRYRTATGDGGGGRIWALDGQTLLATLLPAPEGAEVIVDVPVTAGVEKRGLALEPAAAGNVQIERLWLQ